MGFFYEEEAKAPAKRSIAATQAALANTAKGCEACPLQAVWPRLASARMEMGGNTKDGDILVLGEAPNREDDRGEGAFSSEHWKLLRDIIPGIDYERVAFQNLIRCCPMNERTEASLQEIHACSDYLADDLESHRHIKAIIGVGQAVLNRFFPGEQINEAHGLKMPVKLGTRTVWFYPVLGMQWLTPKPGGWSQDPRDSAAFPIFRADIREFFRNVDSWGKPKVTKAFVAANVLLPKTLKEAEEIYAAMLPGPKAVDVESGNLIKKLGELRSYNKGACLLTGGVSDGEIAMAFPIHHPDGPTKWGAKFLVDVVHRGPWIAHNLGMEWMWIKPEAEKLGIEWNPQEPEDTMALARLLHRRSSLLALDDITMLEFGVQIKSVCNVNARRIMDYTLDEILPYQGLDALSTAMYFKRNRSKVNERNYRRIINTTKSTADMALMGLDLNYALSAKLKKKWQDKADEWKAKAEKLFEVKAFKRERGTSFNIGSDQDVGAVLVEQARLTLPKAKKGTGWQTNDEALQAAVGEEGHPLVDCTLGYREASKMVSTYIMPVLESKERCTDERAHPSYNSMLVETLRLSCEDFNAQNWPSRNKEQKKLKKQVIVPKGHIFYKADFKALEARVSACATRDKNLVESTLKGVDIHSKWRDRLIKYYPGYLDHLASKSGQTEEKALLAAGRNEIKNDFVFASMFGSSVNSCAARTGVPFQHMEHLQEDFWEEHPQVKDWIKKQRQHYKETGTCLSMTGLERHAILSGNEPINFGIQHPGAALVLEAMNDLADKSRKERDPYLHPRIQIHDDLTFILPDNSKTQGYIDRINQSLVCLRFDWQIVPSAVEGMIGYNWADMVEICVVEGDYVR